MLFRRSPKIELLRRIPLFAGYSKHELNNLSLVADEIDLPAGTTLIREGEPSRQFIVVVEGSVDVTSKGRELPLRDRPQFYGATALDANLKAYATVTTSAPVRALVLTDRGIRKLFDEIPMLRLSILQSFVEHMLIRQGVEALP